MGLNVEKARKELEQHAGGEPIAHCAFGIRPVSPLALTAVAILVGVPTVGAGVYPAVQGMRKQFLVGVTASRLLLLRLSSFTFRPMEFQAIPLSALSEARTSAGALFVRLEFRHGASLHALKFHRAAFAGNREGAQAIGQAIASGGLAPAAPAVPVAGSAVLVRWGDGNEYPAAVRNVHGDQYLCGFPDGSETWVSSAYVRALPAPGVASTFASEQEAGAPTSSLWIAAAVAGVALFWNLFWLAYNWLAYEAELALAHTLRDTVFSGLAALLAAHLLRALGPVARGALTGGAAWAISFVMLELFTICTDGYACGRLPFLLRSFRESVARFLAVALDPSVFDLLLFVAYCGSAALAAVAVARKPAPLQAATLA